MSSTKNTGPSSLASLHSVSDELGAVQFEAIEWQERMCGDTDANTEQAFDDWMAMSEEHRQAYLEAELLAEGFEQLAAQPLITERLVAQCDTGEQPALNSPSDIVATHSKPKSVKWFALAIAACLAMVTVFNLGWFVNQEQPSEVVTSHVFQAQYLSDTGELKEISLPDGSMVTLGPNSLLKVNFNEVSRNAELVLGKAYFDVAKAVARPFFVEADQTSVKVVGTRFDVRRLAKATSVSVVEGVVQVFNGKDSARLHAAQVLPATLIAGQYAKSDGKTDIVVQEVLGGEQNSVAWLDGRLVYFGAELRDVITDANRYSKSGSIRLNDPSLGEEKVTLSINVNSIDELPLMLAELMSLEINQNSVETVLSTK